MGWILVLYFTCGEGCGWPISLALPLTYASQQECTDAGNVWLSRKANPTRTVASFACDSVTRPKKFYRHTDRYQE